MEPQNKLSGFGRRYFSRPPLRSYHFWVSTIFVLLVASEAAFYTVRFRSLLNSEAGASMILPVVVILLIWFKVLRSHQRVYAVYRNLNAAQLLQEGALETVLDNLAYLSYAGFCLALFAVGSVYIALAWSLAAATHQ